MFSTPDVTTRPEKGLVKVRFTTDVGVISGHAHCSPQDTWNEKLGLSIATARAKLKYIRLKQPQLKKEYGRIQGEMADMVEFYINALGRVSEYHDNLTALYYELKTQIDSDINL